jgi:hypothetical protein
VVATDRIDPVYILRSVTVMIVLTALCAGVYAWQRRKPRS